MRVIIGLGIPPARAAKIRAAKTDADRRIQILMAFDRSFPKGRLRWAWTYKIKEGRK